MREGLLNPARLIVCRQASSMSWQRAPGLTVASAASMPSAVAVATRRISSGGWPRETVLDIAQWYRRRQPLSSRHVAVSVRKGLSDHEACGVAAFSALRMDGGFAGASPPNSLVPRI